MFPRSSLLCLVALASHALAASRFFNITNNCPVNTPLYIQGEYKMDLISPNTDRQNSYVEMNLDTYGFFWTTVNGGNTDGNGAVRVGLFEDGYYLVRDSSWTNVGVSVTPIGRSPENGFCDTATCELPACGPNNPSNRDAYTSPPTRFPPANSNIPPSPPLHECPGLGEKGFKITFCPSGEIPNLQYGPQSITPVGHPNKCLDVRGAQLQNGTPVQIYDCNGTTAQKWVLKRGRGQIKLGGTNFCLDAGSSSPPNGTGLKIWQCYDNLPAQTWFWDGQNKNIWLSNNGPVQCIDLTDGSLTNGKQTQVWQCNYDNPNQSWQA
jgi:hypothetical protein